MNVQRVLPTGSRQSEIWIKSADGIPGGKIQYQRYNGRTGKNPEAMEIASKAVKLMANMIVSPGEGMWDMMKSMSLKDSVRCMVSRG